jgi:arginine N-succinyltransferase
MFLIREAFREDLEQIHAVARHLNSVNLPDDKGMLEKILDLSEKSFGAEVDVFQREYVFALEDAESHKVIGTSMIHAQHGTRRSPHVFFEVAEDERYSETLDRHFVHQVLRIGYNYAGPTEIGGLILLPGYRGRPEGLGKVLSYVRFLYIAMHRDRFRKEVLSELLPPLEADGTSKLWEALGRHFTGLTYQEADKISKNNKEFIKNLFPQGLIYTVMLPKETQQVIGVVGPQTRGVEKMLKAIGFEYAGRIDPFDGGPHYQAATEDITLVKASKRAKVSAIGTADDGRPYGLVAVEHEQKPRFVATATRFRLNDKGEIGLTDAVRTALGVKPGDEVWYLPL